MTENNRHIHLDLVGGLAGDMFLAGALDAGIVDRQDVQAALRRVGLGPVEIEVERVQRGAIEGTHIRFQGWDPDAEATHRHLFSIREMLVESDLSEAVTDRAVEMFEMLGRAEAQVHGMDPEEVHFHEVGAVDSILDFVAAAWIVETVDASWSVGPIPAGRGTIETDHGTIPVPAPATAKVLEGFEIEYRDVDAELVTPTGATIAATVAQLEGDRRGTLETSGFGAGTRQVEGLSNVVRFSVLQTGDRAPGDESFDRQRIVRLVTEIDDATPEVVARVADRLEEAGALDVVREPVQMKKGRLGTRLAVLCRPDDESALVARIFEETTTLGIRREPIERWVLERTVQPVETTWGAVEVKIGRSGDEILNVSPEFDSCVEVADRAGVEARRVYEAAAVAARRMLGLDT